MSAQLTDPQLADEQSGDDAPRPSKWGSRIVGIVPALIGLAAAIESVRLGVWVDSRPGPGLWPLLAATLTVVAGVVTALTDQSAFEGLQSGELKRVLLALGLLSLFAAFFEQIGIFSSSVVLVTAWLRCVAGSTWKTSVLTGVASAVSCYVLFVELLALPLPVDAFLVR
ncbi:tripartite tricarboxylate transporter TctB family protein [Streptomyces sp. NPDC001027]|uniref:tripartite tricarboxylate transporter TctB family protein n=1 Tax=Streptomyces sp. NPDC001027 TaxID=3154771 RepID=UPI0033342D4B